MAEDPKPAPPAPPPAPPSEMPPTIAELKAEIAKLSKRLGDEFITKAEAAEIRKEISVLKEAVEKKAPAPPAPKPEKERSWWTR